MIVPPSGFGSDTDAATPTIAGKAMLQA